MIAHEDQLFSTAQDHRHEGRQLSRLRRLVKEYGPEPDRPKEVAACADGRATNDVRFTEDAHLGLVVLVPTGLTLAPPVGALVLDLAILHVFRLALALAQDGFQQHVFQEWRDLFGPPHAHDLEAAGLRPLREIVNCDVAVRRGEQGPHLQLLRQKLEQSNAHTCLAGSRWALYQRQAPADRPHDCATLGGVEVLSEVSLFETRAQLL
mmetsp:Transcript_21299/g.59431  ORF Transcript_21299/g.59431 Transcript_21299/m.59431 type:complete len:208 (+) Transcript_21299:964-1587(+)